MRDSLLRTWLLDQRYCDILNDTTKNDFYTNRQFLSNYSMNRLIRQDLTKITLDDDGLPTLGNYATTQLSDDKSKITLNASIYNPFGKKEDWNPIRSILSINVKAATKDNVSTLFSNKNVNNEVGMTLRWSFLSKKTNYQNDDQMLCNALKLYRENLLREYDAVYTRYQANTILFNRKFSSFKKTGDSLRKVIAGLEELKKTADSAKLIYLNVQLEDASIAMLNLRAEYSDFRSKEPVYDSTKIIDSFYNRLLSLETKTIKWSNYRIVWTDIEVSGNGEKYLLVNKVLPLDSQLTNKKFSRWSIGLTRNIFTSQRSAIFHHGLFLKFGYSIGNDNSLTNTTAKDIVTTTTIDTGTTVRQLVEKKSGFDKPFKTSFSHTLSGRISNYLNESHTQAISLTSSFALNFDELGKFYKISDRPIFTPGITYLYAFQNKDKDKNAVNVEVFLNFTDVFNSGKDDTHFYERHDFGIKLGVPFNSIFLN